MATTVNVRDLENYPDNNKTVVVDHKQVVPLGAGGDERWVISATTNATASGSATIQDVFIRTFVIGWTKSTAFEQGPYTISATQNAMKVSINGSVARSIALTVDANPVSGEAVALDMQQKINDLAAVGAVEAGNLAFKNAWVTFENGRFIIQSGSPTASYTGSAKSSVQVTPGTSNDVSEHLGFFAQVSSEGIAGTSITETYLNFPYTSSSGLTLIDVADGSSFSTGDCIGITDGTNTEYRYVSSAAAGLININASLSNDYALNSRVQALRLQDPDSSPVSSFESVDDATRFAISSLVNQIDFS
jgi:hypothetical protein